MITNKNVGIYYYSMTGKTAAILADLSSLNIKRMKDIDPKEFEFGNEDVIIIGSPTYGRGVPPSYFKSILPKLKKLKGRRIGLFGSGNTIYGEYYGGALDILEEVLSPNNEIIFKYKFEGYPTERTIKEFQSLIDMV